VTPADLARLQDGSGFAVLPRRLQGDVTFGVPVEHPEEIVIGAGHDDAEEEEEEEGY